MFYFIFECRLIRTEICFSPAKSPKLNYFRYNDFYLCLPILHGEVWIDKNL